MPVGGRVPMCFPLSLGCASVQSCKLKFDLLFLFASTKSRPFTFSLPGSVHGMSE